MPNHTGRMEIIRCKYILFQGIFFWPCLQQHILTHTQTHRYTSSAGCHIAYIESTAPSSPNTKWFSDRYKSHDGKDSPETMEHSNCCLAQGSFGTGSCPGDRTEPTSQWRTAMGHVPPIPTWRPWPCTRTRSPSLSSFIAIHHLKSPSTWL